MQEMVAEVNALAARARQTRERLAGARGAAADTLAALEEIALLLETEPVRYGRPGLVAQVGYLNRAAGRVDQKLGREVVARYRQLSAEVEAVRTRVVRLLGPGP